MFAQRLVNSRREDGADTSANAVSSVLWKPWSTYPLLSFLLHIILVIAIGFIQSDCGVHFLSRFPIQYTHVYKYISITNTVILDFSKKKKKKTNYFFFISIVFVLRANLYNYTVRWYRVYVLGKCRFSNSWRSTVGRKDTSARTFGR